MPHRTSGEWERRGRGIPQGPGWRNTDDLIAGLSGSGPSAASSRKTTAGPRCGMSTIPGGSGTGDGAKRQQAGGWRSPSPSCHRKPASPPAGGSKGQRKWTRNILGKPGEPLPGLWGKCPAGKHLFCISGALSRVHPSSALSGLQTLATNNLCNTYTLPTLPEPWQSAWGAE